MKSPFSKLAKSNRRGITIVEVLTSIVVAVIGVAGVLVMIPFAVRQASVGLDLDDATAVAENAMAQFQIEGYGQVGSFGGQAVLPWVDVPQQVSIDPMPMPVPVRLFSSNGIYFIDPLWLNAQADPSVANYPAPQTIDDMFYYVGDPNQPQLAMEFQTGVPGISPPFQPRFVHLLDSAEWFDPSTSEPNPMSQAIATRMFVNNNDLQFGLDEDQDGNEIDDKGPPQPYMDRQGATNLRRQSRGELSWNAVAVARRKTAEINLSNPDGFGIRVEGFDFYVLVYKDRNFENPSQILSPDRDPRFLYTALDDDPGANQNEITGTGTIVLEVDDNNPIDIQNDEWIMLANYDRNGQAHVGFFRVIGSDPRRKAITIEGSDFEIQGLLSNNDPARSRTYAIYLPNVINVYKRQLTFESEFSLNQQ